jgi:hypothetical protein
MKLRIGFVSNSSSSSFAIYGLELDGEQLAKLLGVNVDEDDYDLYDLIHGEDGCDEKGTVGYDLEKAGLSEYNIEGDVYYIGRDLTSMKKTETLAEFGERTETALKKALKSEKLPKLSMHIGEYPC